MARDTIKTYVTECPTHSFWFERFMKGVHSRMGDDHRPDAAISVNVMHALMNKVDLDFLESQWEYVPSKYARHPPKHTVTPNKNLLGAFHVKQQRRPGETNKLQVKIEIEVIWSK